MLESYEGTRVLITGASTGLGAEFARQVAARGAKEIVLAARNEERLRQVAAEIEKIYPTRAQVVAVDLAAAGGAAELIRAVALLGREIDVLINNAGFGKWGRFDERGIDESLSMIDLNVGALVELTHGFGRGMLMRGRGGVLNVGSLAGFFTIPYVSVYAATKAFVLAFSEGIFAEWREHGVIVSCLCPGGTESEFHERAESYHHGKRSYMKAAPVVQVGLDGLLAGKPTTFACFKHMAQSRLPLIFTRRRAALIMARRMRPPSA